MRGLEMPKAGSCPCVQRQDAVAEKICSLTIPPVEIECRRAGGGEHPAPLEIDAHPAPVVGASRALPGIAGPCIVPEFSGLGDGMEYPAALARAGIEGSN